MKLALVLITVSAAHAEEANPVGKVLQLLSDLQTKIIGEGEAAQKAYVEYSEWCEERSANLGFDIKTEKSNIASLNAKIEEETALSGSLTEKLESLAADLATDEADLKAATEIRDHENADFLAAEKELSEIVDTLSRAVGILEKEMAKTGSASMMQLKSATNIAQVLDTLVKGASISSEDASRLTALVQSSQQDSDEDVGAPAATVYKGQSGGIIQTLTDLLEKAQGQLADARNTETKNIHNFELMAQGLSDEIKFGKKEMAEAKNALAASGEKKAGAQGDLAATTKTNKEDVSTLADLHQSCLTYAQNYEAETKSRGEELAALAEAKKVISSETVGAEGATYGLNQVSFAQRSQLSSRTDLANFEALRLVRKLAKKDHSSALAQLASRISTAMHASSSAGEDVFGKVKGLIADMIEKLEAEAEADATHKAFCDKELAESNEKKADKNAEIAKLSTKIDQMSARSAQLKSEVAALEKALAALAASQAEMNKIRAEENAAFKQNKLDMEQGLEGIKLALKVLNEYYAKADKAHASADGAGHGIIGLLEVIESDFSQALAEFTSVEETAAADYDRQTKENEIEKTTKDQDVKYKNQEAADLDQAIADASSDRSGVQTELSAVQEYLDSLAAQCITTGGNMGTEGHNAESHEQRVARRTSEINGLKEALNILDGAASFAQTKRAGHRISLRGVLRTD